MPHLTHCIAVSLVTATCLGLTPSAGRKASVLPEVRKHLDAAHKCVATGSFDVAIAHADLVLISDTLSVFVKCEGVTASEEKTCNKAIDAGMTAWEEALDQSIHFRREADPTKADIEIRFRPDVRMGKAAVAGYTNWKRTIKTEQGKVIDTSFKADMQVRSRDLNASPMNFLTMRQEAEHELGHVLGLEDSETMGDLMGPLEMGHAVLRPQDHEIAAVKALRDEANLVKLDAISKEKACLSSKSGQ